MFTFSFHSKIFQSVLSLLLFCFLFLPIYSYRLFVILLAKIRLPSGSEIIDVRSAMFSPCFSTQSPMGAIIAPYIFRESLNTSKVLGKFSALVEKYKKLKSVPVLYWLYTFWVPLPEADFKLSNHIHQLTLANGILSSRAINRPVLNPTSTSTNITTQSEYDILKKLLLQEPFSVGQSPWMIYIVRNLQHELHGVVDVFIFKWHHGLADGLSIFKMLGKSANPPLIPPNIYYTPLSTVASLVTSIQSIFSLLENRFSFKSNTGSVISPPAEKLHRGKDFYLAESDPIPIEYIKQTKRKYNVSFNSVILWALSSALKAYVVQNSSKVKDKKGMGRGSLGEEPADVSTCIVLPYPDHPDDILTNHWTWTVIPLPIFATKGRMLLRINEIVQQSKKKAVMGFKRVPLFGRLPFFFHGEVLQPHSLAFSDFPGPANRINVWGSECVDMSFHINIPPGIIGMFCTSLSYDGKWKMSFVIDGSVANSQKHADNLANSMSRNILEMVS